MGYYVLDNIKVKPNFSSTVIYVDSAHKTVSYFSFSKESSQTVFDSALFNNIIYSDRFFAEFEKIVLNFEEKYHTLVGNDINILLSDNSVTMDIISVPIYKGANRDTLLKSSVKNLFVNLDEIKSHGNLLVQTKQSHTCSYSFMNAKLLNDFRAIGLRNKINVKNISYASNVIAIALDLAFPKLKASNYLFLDMKADFTRFVFCFKGKCVCFYSLPFGYEMLKSDKVVAENMLFNHDIAELEVINARERAKSRKASAFLGDKSRILETAKLQTGDSATAKEIPVDPDSKEDNVIENTPMEYTKPLPKKVEKFLPKYMQRPAPTNDKELTFENFRIFMKWSLNLLHYNEKVTSLGDFNTVLVNIPIDYSFLLDMANAEEQESGVKFLPVLAKEQPVYLEQLELCGGIFMKNSNINVF